MPSVLRVFHAGTVFKYTQPQGERIRPPHSHFHEFSELESVLLLDHEQSSRSALRPQWNEIAHRHDSREVAIRSGYKNGGIRTKI